MSDEIAKSAEQMLTGTQGPGIPTLRENLVRRKEMLENQLKDVNHALEMLTKNPDMEEFMNVIGRV